MYPRQKFDHEIAELRSVVRNSLERSSGPTQNPHQDPGPNADRLTHLGHAEHGVGMSHAGRDDLQRCRCISRIFHDGTNDFRERTLNL